MKVWTEFRLKNKQTNKAEKSLQNDWMWFLRHDRLSVINQLTMETWMLFVRVSQQSLFFWKKTSDRKWCHMFKLLDFIIFETVEYETWAEGENYSKQDDWWIFYKGKSKNISRKRSFSIDPNRSAERLIQFVKAPFYKRRSSKDIKCSWSWDYCK